MSTASIESLTASDGYVLKYRKYRSHQECRGIIVAMHGIQSHSGWYEWSSGKLAGAGFEVWFCDRRGSGLNGRERGHADHGRRLLQDVSEVIAEARRPDDARPAGLPLTVMGLSWGAKIAAAAACTFTDRIDRLALLYPGLKPRLVPTRWQRFRLNAARKHDVRKKYIDIPLQDPALFTDLPEYRRFIADDPLALHRVSCGFLNAGRDLDEIIASQADRIQVPVLTMLAGNDRIIDNAATRQLLAAFGTPRLSVIEYPDACHTLEFDSCRDEFVRDLISWLHSGCPK